MFRAYILDMDIATIPYTVVLCNYVISPSLSLSRDRSFSLSHTHSIQYWGIKETYTIDQSKYLSKESPTVIYQIDLWFLFNKKTIMYRYSNAKNGWPSTKFCQCYNCTFTQMKTKKKKKSANRRNRSMEANFKVLHWGLIIVAHLSMPIQGVFIHQNSQGTASNLSASYYASVFVASVWSFSWCILCWVLIKLCYWQEKKKTLKPLSP